MKPVLFLQDIRKEFDGTPALQGVSLEVARGEIVVLLGPSGCGKTTLLRIIAGLEEADAGQILWRDKPLQPVPVHERGFGMVFQDYALFPHKNVAQNTIFGLRMLGWEPARMQQRLEEVLALVGLEGFGDRSVHELSGGEQQRVALARALAPAPRMLLLDEPLGALDRALRERLMVDLRTILKRAGDRPEGMTAIYVTHDQAEAFAIADRVVVMSAGAIEQIAPPQQLYAHPATPFVARFLGMQNLLPGRIRSVTPLCVETPIGKLAVAGEGTHKPGEETTVLIRPDAARSPAQEAESPNALRVRLLTCSFRGRYQQVTVQAGDVQLKLEFDYSAVLPVPGSELALVLDPDGICIF